MNGKIKSVEKKLYNGNHEKWDSQNGTMYKYNVVIDHNGTTVEGVAMSKSNSGTPYGPGDDVSFELTTDNKGNKLKIKKEEAANGGGKEKSYGANMDHVARQASMNTAIELCEVFSDKVNNIILKVLSAAFHSYIKKSDSREEIYARIATLRMVVEMKKNENLRDSVEYVKSPQDIINAAIKFETYILNGEEIPDKFEV